MLLRHLSGKFITVLVLVIIFFTGQIKAVDNVKPISNLPEGGNGIAARYPGDEGIEKDPNIIFVERFNVDSLEAVFKHWEDIKSKNIMSLSSDTPANSLDGRSLLMKHVGGESTGGHLYRQLKPGYDQVFARFYVKFDPDCGPIHHFGTNLGGNNPSTPWPMVKAGHRPAGDKTFWTGVEPYGKDWGWDFYTYWQGMHIHGDGKYWGTPFLTGGDKRKVEKGKWICIEMMVKLNDPVNESNGEQAFWIDGQLYRRNGQPVSHIGPGRPNGNWTGGWWKPDMNASTTFEGFQWRTNGKLKINYIWPYLYITKSPKGHISKVWFDNIVVAKQYIGPIEK